MAKRYRDSLDGDTFQDDDLCEIRLELDRRDEGHAGSNAWFPSGYFARLWHLGLASLRRIYAMANGAFAEAFETPTPPGCVRTIFAPGAPAARWS
jgi:hypothetical protein